MNFFDSNIEVLESKGQHYLNLSQQLGSALEFVGADEQGIKWFVDENEVPIAVTATIDEERLPNPNLMQLIFFFGLASVDEILNVASHADSHSVFIIIEPNLSLLKYALNNEDFRRLSGLNYIIAAVEPEEINEILTKLLYTPVFLLIKQPVFYFNSYYRQRETKLLHQFIVNISNTIKHKFFKIGNSIQDSLVGLIQNMQNIEKLATTPDVRDLKNKFQGVPAFLVAAGPSLDKNIEELKRVQNKGIIIAVDTIANKLVNNGIIPDFLSSVERVLVWETFIENKSYPETMYLVGPPLLQPPVVERFAPRALLPMRQSVREYIWLSEMLGLSEEYKMWMGACCAHVAMGLAVHLGASPLVMVGQDLAYGEDEQAHASGTAYDEVGLVDECEDIPAVEGYYGKDVRTHELWQGFKIMFEDYIKMLPPDTVINATEGGVRIKGAVQRPLREVVSEYCNKEIGDICSILDKTARTKVDWPKVTQKMRRSVTKIDKFSSEVQRHLKKLEDIRDNWDKHIAKPDGPVKVHKTLQKTDKYFKAINDNQLLAHNLQGATIVLMQKFHLIEDDGTVESLYKNLIVQIELCSIISETSWLIAQLIEENYPWQLEAPVDNARPVELKEGRADA